MFLIASTANNSINEGELYDLSGTLRATKLTQGSNKLPVKLRRPAPPCLPCLLLLRLQAKRRRWHDGCKFCRGSRTTVINAGRKRSLQNRRHHRQSRQAFCTSSNLVLSAEVLRRRRRRRRHCAEADRHQRRRRTTGTAEQHRLGQGGLLLLLLLNLHEMGSFRLKFLTFHRSTSNN